MRYESVNLPPAARTDRSASRMPSRNGRVEVALLAPRRFLGLFVLLGAVLLIGCSTRQASQPVLPPTAEKLEATAPLVAQPTAGAGETSASQPALPPTAAVAATQVPLSEDLLRSDSQGAVEVDVMPVDLDGDDDAMLAFEVGMSTHSVDLSMDLAGLSTLQADNGVTVEALDWSGGSGHHVQGVLRFPAKASDGRSVMEGASHLVLIIRNVDAQERTFEWNLPAAQ